MYKILSFILVIATMVASISVAANDNAGTFIYPLKKDTILWVKNAALSHPKKYWNEMNEAKCFNLSINSQAIGYIYAIRKTKSKTIVYSCEEFDDKSSNTSGSIYGDIDGLPKEIQFKGGEWQLLPHKLSDFEIWPYGTYCNDLIAYWGIREGGDFLGYIYDLSNRKYLKRASR